MTPQVRSADPPTESAKGLVVLIPGLGNNHRLWAAQVEALSHDHQVVVADFSGATSIDEMGDRVLEQVHAASFAVAGFSLGGYVALRLADRAANRIKRLALLSSSPYADSERIVRQRELLISRAMQDYRSLLEEMSRTVVFAGGPHAETARQAMITMGLELGAEEFCRQQRAAMHRIDSRERLGAIACPVKVLCGHEDRVTPTSGNRHLAENIPGATLEIVQEAGHLLPLERPNEVTRFLRDWLQPPTGTDSHRDS